MLPLELILFIVGVLGALLVLTYRVGYTAGKVDKK